MTSPTTNPATSPVTSPLSDPLSTLEPTDPHTVRWRKSSYSDGGASNCVEVAAGAYAGVIPVRDSKDPHGPALAFSAAGWSAFVSAIQRGEFPSR